MAVVFPSKSDIKFKTMTAPAVTKSVIDNLIPTYQDLSPFLIVSIVDLWNMGKATYPTNIKIDNSNAGLDSYYISLMNFKSTDAYLPLGDVIYNTKQKIETVFVVLIKNNSKYSSIITEDSWKFVVRSRDMWNIQCHPTLAKLGMSPNTNSTPGTTVGILFNVSAINDPGGIYKNNYAVLGSVFGVMAADDIDTDDIWNVPGTHCNFWNYANRPFAAVHTNYLKKLVNVKTTSPDVLIAILYATYHLKFTLTSAFNTFNIAGTENTGGAVRTLTTVYKNNNAQGGNIYFPIYNFYDIIPEILQVLSCGKQLPTSIIARDSLLDIHDSENSPNICENLMSSYCKADNLLNPECKNWCSVHNCDTNLKNFCTNGKTVTVAESLTDAELFARFPKYNANSDICSCFMPPAFYETLDINRLTTTQDGTILYNALSGAGIYRDRTDCVSDLCHSSKVRPYESHTVSCPAKNIQVCSNDGTVLADTVLSSTINIEQKVDCVQNIGAGTFKQRGSLIGSDGSTGGSLIGSDGSTSGSLIGSDSSPSGTPPPPPAPVPDSVPVTTNNNTLNGSNLVFVYYYSYNIYFRWGRIVFVF